VGRLWSNLRSLYGRQSPWVVSVIVTAAAGSAVFLWVSEVGGGVLVLAAVFLLVPLRGGHSVDPSDPSASVISQADLHGGPFLGP
jgi:hypothetical protein